VDARDVVIKQTEPLRLAAACRVAAGLAPEHIGPVFLALAPELIAHVQRAGAWPGVLVHYYDEPADDGSVSVHVGYEIGQQPVPASDGAVAAPDTRASSITKWERTAHASPSCRCRLHDELLRAGHGSAESSPASSERAVNVAGLLRLNKAHRCLGVYIFARVRRCTRLVTSASVSPDTTPLRRTSRSRLIART
jgi:hypothetical protein